MGEPLAAWREAAEGMLVLMASHHRRLKGAESSHELCFRISLARGREKEARVVDLTLEAPEGRGSEVEEPAPLRPRGKVRDAAAGQIARLALCASAMARER